MFTHIFKHKKSDTTKLKNFGFTEDNGTLNYTTTIMNSSFNLEVIINHNDQITTNLTEIETSEEYILYKTNASGDFVTSTRKEIEDILITISNACFYDSIYKFNQTVEVIAYVSQRFGDALEFLWEKSPNNAVFRHKETKKWYAAILSVDQCKLGMSEHSMLEVINLRVDEQEVENLIDGKSYFKAWHMNKKHWVSLLLDGSINTAVICQRIEESYLIAATK